MQRLDVPPMLLLDKKGTRTAELVQPAKEENWDSKVVVGADEKEWCGAMTPQ